jgi:hypothetical protein
MPLRIDVVRRLATRPDRLNGRVPQLVLALEVPDAGHEPLLVHDALRSVIVPAKRDRGVPSRSTVDRNASRSLALSPRSRAAPNMGDYQKGSDRLRSSFKNIQLATGLEHDLTRGPKLFQSSAP